MPHYLSIFWQPLNSNPWDIVGGAIVIVVLVSLNVVGVQEAAKLSISLAVVDFATQILLVIVGFALVFSPQVLVDNVHWGVAPTWSNLAIAIPVAMLAYTGVETVSNLAEEARDPVRTVPNAYRLVAGAVFAIYFTLPLVALSALPVTMINGQLTTRLALPPEEGGYANDPILGVVKNLGLDGVPLRVAEIYVGILAATILFIATNAGVIGASRITYSMATTGSSRRCCAAPPALQDAVALARAVRRHRADPAHAAGRREVHRHALLAGRHAVVHRRARVPRAHALGRPGYLGRAVPRAPEHPDRHRSWPLFAIVGGIATGISFLVLVVQNPLTRWVGLGWMAFGLVGYTSTAAASSGRRCAPSRRPRRRSARRSPSSTGPPRPGRSGQPSDAAIDVACRLASERRAHHRPVRPRGSARPPLADRSPTSSLLGIASSTRPSRSATRTAFPSSRGSSGRAPPAPRSSRRRTRVTPRSSCSDRPARRLTARAVRGLRQDGRLRPQARGCRVLVTAAEPA